MCTKHKGGEKEGKRILKKVYPPNEVEAEIAALKESVEMEAKESDSAEKMSIVKLLNQQ